MYQHTRLTNNNFSFFQKFKNFDYILLVCILLLGFISLATMYSTDGGNILFDSYDPQKKLVKVVLQGACSGCPSSTVTLKNGIENMLKEMLSEKVNSVEAING